uniref:Fibrinogen C-terminal domain-containing protein n=1 Tax=Ciona savignyi TaxID=51511 RepID=H2YD60_CIOSA
MRTRQDNTEEQIRSLRQENERNRNLQTIQNQLALARQQKATLEQQKTELQNRNNILETERIGLVRIQDQFHPLQSNHTQLRRDFAAIQQQLRHLQGQHEILTANYTKLERTKNCSDVNKHLPSCAVIRQWGYTESGHAMIDPDGQGGVKPFMVYCDMHSDPSTGITVVENELQPNMTIQGCNGQGCLSVDVTYKGATMEQIEALMSISIACEQKIRYDCQDSKLLKEGTAWWESRTGQRMNYWGGAAP